MKFRSVIYTNIKKKLGCYMYVKNKPKTTILVSTILPSLEYYISEKRFYLWQIINNMSLIALQLNFNLIFFFFFWN